MKKAFIEHDFPVKEVSEHSGKEKSVRHGHPSTLHIWWARRPLASSRATIYASLIPEPKNELERKEKSKFIAEFSQWKNSNNKKLIEKAKKDILQAYGGIPPKVLDPFSGGGSIPLEALRLGCETNASDLNPVAVLIEKATLEFPQKYGRPITREEYYSKRPWMKDELDQLSIENTINPLLKDIKYWVKQVQKKLNQKMLKYSNNSDVTNVGHIWARTIECNNPSCKIEIPLIRQTWLSRKNNKRIAYKLIPKSDYIDIEIFENQDIDFDPSIGTAIGGKAICPKCSYGHEPSEIKNQFWSSKSNHRLLVSVFLDGNKSKFYVKGNYVSEEKIKSELKHYKENFNDNGLSTIPDEFIHTPTKREYTKDSLLYNFTPVLLYRMTKWRHLFNDRQLLFFTYFSIIIQDIVKNEISKNFDDEYVNVINTYIAFIFDRILDYNTTLCVWAVSGEFVAHTFGRQALPMTWDYFEVNPLSGSTGSIDSAMDWIARVIENVSKIDNIAKVEQMSATKLDLKDNSYDAIFTDPPYYDNVPYADLSDFFYVWLKRNIITDSSIFSTPLTPKKEEITDTLALLRGLPKAIAYENKELLLRNKQDFEKLLKDAFCEFNRILKPDGIVNIVYAHKSVDAWETVINAILKSGFYLTASWPLHTEMKARLRAKKSAALASSIYMVCRKRNTDETAYYNEIKPAIEKRIHQKLDQFWAEGIGGSDFFISAIGPAVEVFGKYASVEKLSGEKVSVKELLEYVRQIVSEYALSRILKSPQLGGVDQLTRFYLVWRWTFGNNLVPFDDGNKMALSIGIGMDEHWDRGGIIHKAGDKVKVKSHVERRKDQSFETRLEREYPQIKEGGGVPSGKQTLTLIDVFQGCLMLWDRSDRTTIARLLEASGYRKNDLFWQVAQSVSDVLPDGDKEKQTIQAFLLGKESYMKGEVPLDMVSDKQETIFGEE